MGCCLGAVFALIAPRVVLVLLFLFTHWLERAFPHQFILPLLGFIFLPITTIVYAWIIHSGAQVAGGYLVALVVAVILDAGSWGGGHYSRRNS